MTAQKKTILIIEDDKQYLKIINDTLSLYGFHAEGGGTIADTLELLKQHKNDAAVIILDMNLIDFSDYVIQRKRTGADITGVSLAKEILLKPLVQRPELIIISAWADKSEYFQQALEAGVSVYLLKGEAKDLQRFVPVIQALALKYSFQPNVPNDREIARLVEGYASSFDLLHSFCRTKLARELDACLTKASYLLLFRERPGTREDLSQTATSVGIYADVTAIPDVEEFDYNHLHQRIFQRVPRHALYSLTPEAFPGAAAEKLQDFHFFQLVRTSEVEIAVGVLTPFPVKDPWEKFPFSVESFAQESVIHAAPVLDMFVEKLMFRWRENLSVKQEKVKSLANLSGSFQRELLAVVPDKTPDTVEQAEISFARLNQLSEKLTEYNRTLSLLLETPQSEIYDSKDQGILLSEVVQEIQIEYDRTGYLDEVTLSVEADGFIPANRYFFSRALRELIKWAVERKKALERQRIQIRCVTQGNWLEIHFQEQSERLSKRVRESYLFEPILSLHIAQMIIEVACHGKLIDGTDELETALGNRLIIKLLNK